MSIRYAGMALALVVGVAGSGAGAYAGGSGAVETGAASSEAQGEELFGWRRRFSPPLRELPISLSRRGSSFIVSTPTLGVLRSPVDLPLFTATSCNVQTRIDPDTVGYTVVYTITNQTGQVQDLPALQIPGNLLERRLENLDHRFGCNWEVVDASNGEQYSSRQPKYPESLYAPAIILRDQRFAVGFSLQYDVMTYQHQIRTSLYRGADGTTYGDRWTAKFYLDGTIAPGQSRSYRIHAYYNQPADWIHTMRPYKKFLDTRYGTVKYRQDMRPVWAQQLGDTARLSSENPRGFNGVRADLNGFERDVTSDLQFVLDSGYKRMLVRTCAGVYYENRHNNFPPQIMTSWTTPMEATKSEWERFGQAGVDLIFWWGRSGQFADRWDDDELEPFDPDNAPQADAMILEWTKALSIGAKGLGLDKFTQMPPWDAATWLSRLWSHDPDAFFVAEPVAYDILNLWVPTFLYSADVTPAPHILADYLVPGREIWVLLEGDDNTVERAIELIGDGLTIVTNTKDFTAYDLEEAIRRAQNRP